MKLFKVNGRKIAAKTISDAVEAYKAKRIDLDDASASGTAELTDIINDLLQKKEPLDINERIDVNGKRVKGQIRVFWNGGEIQLGFTPKSGDFAMLGKSSSVGVPVDRKTKTVKRSDVNKAAQAIFEFADKQTETQKSLANEKPKLLGYKLEFIEGEQSGIRKRMMNKLVDFDDMVRFLQGEEDRRQSTGAKGYDKAYIDAVYSIGGKHYRVHGARFDVGDGGDVRSRLKAETGYLDKEIEAFWKSGYSRSVKEGDCKDASGVDFDYLLAEERKAVNDYRTAISQTDDTKLLTVLSHILKEETEHIEELEAARKGVYEDKGLQDAVGTSYENENYKREWKETLSLWEEYKRKSGSRRDYDLGEYVNGDPGLDSRQKIMTKNGPDRPNWRGHAAVRKVLKEILAGKKPVYQGQVLDAYGTTMIGNGPLATFAEKKNTYYVLKVKSRENGGGWGPEKYLVTSADYKDRGASLYGTFENTLGEAKQTAKRYAERDSVKDTAYLRTPRGTFELSNESEEMLRHKGWGLWFEHEADGKFYRIMHDPKTQSAVAVFVRNV